jgi:hypothetical protein
VRWRAPVADSQGESTERAGLKARLSPDRSGPVSPSSLRLSSPLHATASRPVAPSPLLRAAPVAVARVSLLQAEWRPARVAGQLGQVPRDQVRRAGHWPGRCWLGWSYKAAVGSKWYQGRDLQTVAESRVREYEISDLSACALLRCPCVSFEVMSKSRLTLGSVPVSRPLVLAVIEQP